MQPSALDGRRVGPQAALVRRGLPVTIAAAVFLATMLAFGASAERAAAVDYNGTNPGATPCGDGSNEVLTLRRFYLKASGSGLARIDMRYSPLCNTIWTRAVNITGTGAGYLSERSITSTEQI